MKKSLSLIFTALFLIGCQNQAQQTPQTANTNTATIKPDNSTIVSSHSSDALTASAPPANKTGSTESPMAKPIDVAEMTAGIEKAEKEFKKNPTAKEDLAKAYFVRATALTEAAQYRAALGDYRKGLKLNPADEDAKKMHDQILSIFKSIGREPPKEGEEPPPLPNKN
jgi:tetratricopeptide (TPR) repeat protein